MSDVKSKAVLNLSGVPCEIGVDKFGDVIVSLNEEDNVDMDIFEAEMVRAALASAIQDAKEILYGNQG